ncbi:metal-dependent transcriptional regulator [Flaviaesturariibacter amylovorans]|uniref:Transcriptional regulator MntR n=1 Tax=Flaviaesturariibacter amylovorans TaxID=1084520 RepID=A0ABP8GFU7_9BACT
MLNLSASEENYLKAIYHLQAGGGNVSTKALAESLQARPASITDMMKKLDAKKLLHYRPYYGFTLSPEGRKAALGIIRRHRLWEFFLAEKLGFAWEEVHPVAEELEHVRHKKLVDKLDAFLGFPRFDPHGDPIPDSKGRMDKAGTVPLSELPLQQPARVCRVAGQSSELLELLREKGIGIGTRVEVRRRFTYDGSLQVQVRPNRSETISAQLAQTIIIEL